MAFYVNIDLMVWCWVNRYWPWPVLRFIIHNNHLFVLFCYTNGTWIRDVCYAPQYEGLRSEAWLFNYSVYDCLLLVWSVVCMFYEGRGLPTFNFFLLTYLHRLSSQLLSALLFCCKNSKRERDCVSRECNKFHSQEGNILQDSGTAWQGSDCCWLDQRCSCLLEKVRQRGLKEKLGSSESNML